MWNIWVNSTAYLHYVFNILEIILYQDTEIFKKKIEHTKCIKEVENV